MSGLLLTIGKRSRIPYIIQEKEAQIFSLEELCYYLYHNMYRITREFFQPELIEYIKKELLLEKLAKQLIELIKKEATLEDMIMTVMKYANYYNTKELEVFQEKLYTFRYLSKEEKLKLMGDNCLQEEKIKEAVQHYDKALDYIENSQMEPEFWGKIYYNIGICYIHMLFYEEAAKYFEKSYQILQQESITKQILLTWYLSGNQESYQNYAKTLEKEQYKEWETEWKKKSEYIQKMEEVTYIVQLYEQGNITEYREQLKDKIEEWKQNYRSSMS